MGVFTWPLWVSSLDGQLSRDVDAMVDTGASYTVLPTSLLQELGVEPAHEANFEIADGRIVTMPIGRVWATIDGASEITLAVFGDDDAPALLGAYTLEGLRLAVDPINRKLAPTHAILY